MNDLEEVVDLDEFFKDICSHYPINEVEIKYRGLEYFQLTGVRSAYDDLKYPPAVTEIIIKTQYFGWSYTLASFEFYEKKDNIVKRDLLKLSFIHNFSSGQVFEVIGKYIIHKELKMSEFKKYQRTNIAEMRPYIKGEDLSNVSVSPEDDPENDMGMIARNPDNYQDQWYVNSEYFKKNFKIVSDKNSGRKLVGKNE